MILKSGFRLTVICVALILITVAWKAFFSIIDLLTTGDQAPLGIEIKITIGLLAFVLEPIVGLLMDRSLRNYRRLLLVGSILAFLEVGIASSVMAQKLTVGPVALASVVIGWGIGMNLMRGSLAASLLIELKKSTTIIVAALLSVLPDIAAIFSKLILPHLSDITSFMPLLLFTAFSCVIVIPLIQLPEGTKDSHENSRPTHGFLLQAIFVVLSISALLGLERYTDPVYESKTLWIPFLVVGFGAFIDIVFANTTEDRMALFALGVSLMVGLTLIPSSSLDYLRPFAGAFIHATSTILLIGYAPKSHRGLMYGMIGGASTANRLLISSFCPFSTDETLSISLMIEAGIIIAGFGWIQSRALSRK